MTWVGQFGQSGWEKVLACKLDLPSVGMHYLLEPFGVSAACTVVLDGEVRRQYLPIFSHWPQIGVISSPNKKVNTVKCKTWPH